MRQQSWCALAHFPARRGARGAAAHRRCATPVAPSSPIRRAGRWAIRALAALSLLGLLTALTLVAVIVRYGDRDRARPADVIIVLGGGDVGTSRRALHAAALYRAGLAPTVLCTGGSAAGYHEAEACAQIAQEQGVPDAAILLEGTSRSTEENAIGAARVMAAHGWHSAVLVSDDFHLWRARWLFAEQGIVGYPSPAQITTGALPADETLWALARELAAVMWHVGKGLLGLPCTRAPV